MDLKTTSHWITISNTAFIKAEEFWQPAECILKSEFAGAEMIITEIASVDGTFRAKSFRESLSELRVGS